MKRSMMALAGAFVLVAGVARAAAFDPSQCGPNETEAQCKARLGVQDQGTQGQGVVKKSETAVTGTAQAAGSEAKTATQELGNAIAPASEGMGIVESGPVSNTLTTDIAGWFDGNGVNAQFEHVLTPHFSGMLGANYTRAPSVSGSITMGGAEVGVDWFLIGQNNEGLRIGPRGFVGIGWDSSAGSSAFFNGGVGGELGYNWVSASGLTAGAAGGLDARFGAQLGNNTTGEANIHPYGKLNLGYSW